DGTRLERVACERACPARERVVTTEVPGRAACRERARTRRVQLEPWCQLLERDRNGLEGARVARRVVFEHDELGTPRLRLAPPQTHDHAFTTGGGRARDDAVGEEHGGRFVELH